jgi:phosphatidate cytidylyltransferase
LPGEPEQAPPGTFAPDVPAGAVPPGAVPAGGNDSGPTPLGNGPATGRVAGAAQPGAAQPETVQPETAQSSAAQPEIQPGAGAGAGAGAVQPEAVQRGAAQPGPDSQPLPGPASSAPAAGGKRPPRAGRNLPAALGVGAALGALALTTLFTVKATFLAVVCGAVCVGLWELSRALLPRGIRLPLIPLTAGTLTTLLLAYWEGDRAVLATLAFTAITVFVWRLRGGAAGYLRDVTAGVFAIAYLPLLGSFVALMLAAPDGARRTLMFLILAVCSDVGGYASGVLLGRHLMAPAISPKKTWEGLGGSVAACLAGGGIALPLLLHAAVWQGLLLGAAAVAAAILGDLAESMIKRDLQIKDMGSVLPGHGGLLDRMDSMLIAAPVVWLLLIAFLPHSH